MRLSEYGLSPATRACLRQAGITSAKQLLDRSCQELIEHPDIGPDELWDILHQLHQHGTFLRAKKKTKLVRMPSERNLEMLRLRLIEGLTLAEIGQRTGVTGGRVSQLLKWHFALHDKPAAVKARRRQRSLPGCVQVGLAIQRLRAVQSLTIEQLATATEMPTEHLERIEEGLRDPTWTTLCKLALALDTTTSLLAYTIEVEQPQR